MTRSSDVDELVRAYLAEQGRRIEADAPSLEDAVLRVSPRLAPRRSAGRRQMTLLLAAALLLATVVASAIAIGSGLVPLPSVREPDPVVDPEPTHRPLVGGPMVISTEAGLRIRDLDEPRSSTLLHTEPDVKTLAVSPDGARVAFQTSRAGPGAMGPRCGCTTWTRRRRRD
jgi:hypothetical protein